MTIFKHVVSGPGAAGDVWNTGLHTQGVLGIVAAHAAWASAVNTILNGGVADHWPLSTVATQATTYVLNTTTGKATAVQRSSMTIAGFGAGTQGPPRMCTVAGLRTNTPGPSGRGRMFLPGVQLEDLTATGLIESAARTAIATAVRDGLADLDTAGLIAGVWRLGQLVTDPYTYVTVGQVPGTQRRRSNKIPASYVVSAAV